MPDAIESVCVAAVTLAIVMRLPAVPFRLKLLNVVVVPAVKRTDAGCTVFVMLLNVFAPVIVSAPAPPWLMVQLYVDPPPTKVLAVAAVMEIVPVPVPAVVVYPVGAALLNAVAAAVGQISVPPLKVRSLVPVPVVYAVPTVSVLPFRLIVPLVCVSVRADPIVRASCNTHDPPTPLNVSGKSIVLVLVVIVRGVPDVDEKSHPFAPAVYVAPDAKTKSP